MQPSGWAGSSRAYACPNPSPHLLLPLPEGHHPPWSLGADAGAAGRIGPGQQGGAAAQDGLGRQGHWGVGSGGRGSEWEIGWQGAGEQFMCVELAGAVML